MTSRGLVRLAAAASLAALATGTRADEMFTRASSPGGIAYWRLTRPDAETTSLVAGFADGFALTHPDKASAALVGGALLRYGPKDRSAGDYMEEMKDLEARCNLSAAPMSTTFSTEARPGDFAEALGLCYDIVLKPALRPADLDKIRKAAKTGHERAMESREAVAALTMRRLTLGSSPFATWNEPARIDAVGIEDIDAWRREVFARDNAIIVVVGPQDEAETGRLIDSTFGSLPSTAAAAPGLAPMPAHPAKTIVVEKSGEQTAVAMQGYLDLEMGEGPIALVGANVLGGGLDRRLSKAVRGELGATYGISANLGQIAPMRRTFNINTAMSNDLAAEGLKRIREVYQTWRRDGVTDEEVAAAREQLASGFEKSAETSAGKAFGMLSLLRNGAGAEYEATYNDRLRRIDAAAVSALDKARTPAELTTVVVAPKADGFAADCVIHSVEEVDGCR